MNTSTDRKQKGSWPIIVVALGIVLFGISGILSSYLYHTIRQDNASWIPGIIFISTTVLYFLLVKLGANILQVLVYFVFMVATYLILFFVTSLSTSLAVGVGCITAGIGAVATLAFTNCS